MLRCVRCARAHVSVCAASHVCLRTDGAAGGARRAAAAVRASWCVCACAGLLVYAHTRAKCVGMCKRCAPPTRASACLRGCTRCVCVTVSRTLSCVCLTDRVWQCEHARAGERCGSRSTAGSSSSAHSRHRRSSSAARCAQWRARVAARRRARVGLATRSRRQRTVDRISAKPL
jgi:hypothetical protein